MKRNITRLACILPIGICAFEYPNAAFAQSAPLVDVCSGLSVKLPVLTPVASTLDVLLNGVVGAVNSNLVGQLSGKNIGVSVLDTSGNLVSTPGDCKLSTSGIVDTTNQGITVGGGAIDGLGGSGAAALAGSIDAIAVGNGATTATTATGAVALGLRGSVTAVDGVSLGRDTTTSATGGVALGAGSVANRAGMNGAAEAFSGTAVTSTAGAVSVGATGSERQITNVAGGTADTDAVNVRQLNAVNTSLTNDINNVNTTLTTNINNVSNSLSNVSTTLTNQINNVNTTLTNSITTTNTNLNNNMTSVATALGGGSSYDTTTNIFNGPSYSLRGVIYNNVGSALVAIDNVISGTGTGGAIASNNDANVANASATGSNATAVGYGSSATYNNSISIGNSVATTRVNQVAIGQTNNTYTLAGVTSKASAAAQVGPTQVVTTDAYGNLASANVDMGQMSNDISNLKKTTSDIRKEARGGIAAAMAMAATPTPSAPGKTAWATNVATFSGRVAGSLSIAHRVDVDYPLIVNAAIGYSPGTPAGVRVGVSGEF